MTTQTAVHFGTLSSPVKKRRPLRPLMWTCAGALAIPLWALWPTLSLQTRSIPPFECLMIAYLVGAIVLSRLERPARAVEHESKTWKSWVPPLAFAVAMSGSSGLFLVSTHYISAAEANLITYLWPGLLVGFGAVLKVFRLRPRHVVGIALGFVGATIVMGGAALAVSYTGIGLALLGAVFWALYCVFRLIWKLAPGSVLTRGCALTVVLCGALHVALEPTVLPSIQSAGAAVAIGLVPLALGNWA